MDLCDYLSEWKNYAALIREGQYEARRLFVYNAEDIDDITSEAIEELLDYFERKPDKVLQIEAKEAAEMNNYLRKAMRNRVFNIVKKRNRQKAAFIKMLTDNPELYKRRLDLVEKSGEPEHFVTEILNIIREKFGLTVPDIDQFNLNSLGKEMHFFIEERFGRERWGSKKEAVDLFLERVEKNMSLIDLEKRYPRKKIASLNTEAHRIMKGYLKWLNSNHKSRLFRNAQGDISREKGGHFDS